VVNDHKKSIMTTQNGFDHFKARRDKMIELFNELKGSITREEAICIINMNDSKRPRQNAVEYCNALGFVFGDPNKPKQTLAGSLADIIVTRSQT
jgi:hypothetical protein